ncbi:MAG TPA: hypothetical protein VMU33_18015, partial [Burkholderiaceae bacterium]|nr:hypothetical protein [Burkholderiaceae bacterium]
DHGFATISKHEVDAQGHASTSYSTRFTYAAAHGGNEVVPGWLPPGFLAIDLAHGLQLPLFDPDRQGTVDGRAQFLAVEASMAPSPVREQRPVAGNGLIGGSGAATGPLDAQVIVAANGGSDLVYVPSGDAALVRRVVGVLAEQDYVGALFVDPRYGDIPGALSEDEIGLVGTAQMPRPAIVVGFKTFSTDPANPEMTSVQVADTTLQEGQGMHGSLGRDNTYNHMAAIGPDFKRGFVDPAPVGNADVAPTLARVLGLHLPSQGRLVGRVLAEALAGGPEPAKFERQRAVSAPLQPGARATALEYQVTGSQRYVDVACFVPPEAASCSGGR